MIKRTDNVFANRSNLGLCTPGTRIPRATNNSNNMSSPDHTKETVNLSTYVEKWKNRYEDSERRHKAHLLKAEKAKREYDDLTRRYNIALEERNHLSNELLERERELNKLRQVSEKLFQEYQQLKHQHDLDKGIMEKVMQQAGEWYKQNKKLKRRSTALLSALPVRPTDIDLTDSTDTASDTSSNEEVEFLKQTVSELSAQVATLQADLSAVRLSEFEAHELQVTLAQELEQEREKSQVQEKELQELRSQIEQHNRVSKLLIDEVSALKNNADKDREMAETYKSEAMTAKKRVRLLTHQSALLMGELEMDERLMLLLNEVDSLKEALENQALRHREQIEELQLKLTEKHEDTDILLWEEKIRLAEDDARRARERAERAEKRLTQVQEESKSGGRRRGGIMSKISYFESGGESRENIEAPQNIAPSTTPLSVSEPESLSPNSIPKSQSPLPSLSTNTSTSSPSAPSPVNTDHVTSSASASHVTSTSSVSVATEAVTSAPPPPPPPPVMPPPPPPPPPPPAPPAVFNGNAPTNMADLLASKQGTLKKSSKQNGGGAIDAIVDQIKGGKFQLKSTEQNFLEKKPKDEQPEAVKEMLAILGTLRKRRSVNRTSSFVSSKSVDKS